MGLMRRRGLLAEASGGGAWTDYVQNGLEVIWDGIENTRNGHVTTPTNWENLVSTSYDMKNKKGSSFQSDCAVFTGSEWFKTAYTNKKYATVEVVFQKDNSSEYILVKTSNSGASGNGIALIDSIGTSSVKVGTYSRHGSQVNSSDLAPGVKVSLSVTQGTNTTDVGSAYANGMSASHAESSVDWAYGNYSIGAYDRYANGGYFFKGKIYCIRLYTRELTESEVLHNYAIDKQRFGL